MSTETRQQELRDLLKKLNLSTKEIDVLFALLKIGHAGASNISNNLTNISRTSVYDQLQSLEKKGLVSTRIEGKNKTYQVEHLSHLIDKLEQEKKEIEQKQNNLRSITDAFEQMKNGTTYKAGVRTFKGRQGIKAVHREIQDARKELRAIGDLSAVIRTFPEIKTEDNLKDFQTYQIPRKSLIVQNTAGETYIKVSPPSETHTIHWLPKDTSIDTDTLIWDGHVAIIDYREPVNATVIDNPTIYNTFVDWFEMLWKTNEKTT